MNYLWSYIYPEKPSHKLELGTTHSRFIASVQQGVELRRVQPLTRREKLMRDIRCGVALRHIDSRNKSWTRPKKKISIAALVKNSHHMAALSIALSLLPKN